MANNNPLPQEEITLRCSRCGKPISPAEAIQTPTGYRCADCVKQQQKVFDTSKPLDAFIGIIVAGILSYLGSSIASRVGFFTVLLSPAIGVGIAEAVRFLTKKRRSKRLYHWVVIGVILGSLPRIGISLFSFLFFIQSGELNLMTLLPLAYQVAYLILAVPSTYYRLSGKRRL